MKPKKPLRTLSLLFVLVFLLNSCKPPQPGIYINDKIPSDQKSTFHDLNTQLFDGLKVNAKKKLLSILSKEMVEDNSNLKTIEVISNHNKEGEYTLLDEYYMVNTKRKNDSIKVDNRNINNHQLNYQVEAPEMYMAFFGQKGLANQWLVSAMYCKYSYGWKLINLEINPYTQNGKTAPELYDFAKDRYAKGYLIDAANLMAGASICRQPFHGWEYPDAQKMDSFYADMLEKANSKYLFPMVIRQVPTQPLILRITTQKNAEGAFPQIFYQSTVKLSNIAGLKRENEAIRKNIGKLIPGINKDKKYVFYTIFNKLPNSYESVDRYEVTDTLK